MGMFSYRIIVLLFSCLVAESILLAITLTLRHVTLNRDYSEKSESSRPRPGAGAGHFGRNVGKSHRLFGRKVGASHKLFGRNVGKYVYIHINIYT